MHFLDIVRNAVLSIPVCSRQDKTAQTQNRCPHGENTGIGFVDSETPIRKTANGCERSLGRRMS